jgi:hypothetical protein
MKWKRLKTLAAMMLIGDGFLTMLRPDCDARTRETGPEAWNSLMRYLSDHSDLLRAIGVAEVALGLALVASNGSAAELMAEEAAAMRARIRSIA